MENTKSGAARDIIAHSSHLVAARVTTEAATNAKMRHLVHDDVNVDIPSADGLSECSNR